MPGQSFRWSKSSSRRFVTNILTSEAGIGLSGCGLVADAFTDRLREWPWVGFAVAVDVCEVGRDMLSSVAWSRNSDSGVFSGLTSNWRFARESCWLFTSMPRLPPLRYRYGRRAGVAPSFVTSISVKDSCLIVALHSHHERSLCLYISQSYSPYVQTSILSQHRKTIWQSTNQLRRTVPPRPRRGTSRNKTPSKAPGRSRAVCLEEVQQPPGRAYATPLISVSKLLPPQPPY